MEELVGLTNILLRGSLGSDVVMRGGHFARSCLMTTLMLLIFLEAALPTPLPLSRLGARGDMASPLLTSAASVIF